FQQIMGLMMVVAGRESRLDIGKRGRVLAEIRLLRQGADRGSGLHEARAGGRLDQAGGDPEQRRFAGPVAADQADPLAGRNVELDAREQRRASEGELDVLELNEGRRHRQAWFVAAWSARRRWMRRRV